MPIQLSWPAIIVLAAGFGTLYLISYLLRYRHKPGAAWFIVTLTGQAIFCFAYGLGLMVFDPALRFWLEILSLIGLAWLGVPFLGFALGYTGRGAVLDSWLFKGLLGFPIATTVLLPTTPLHELFISDFELAPVYGAATVDYTLEPVLFIGVLGAGTVVVAASLLLFDTVFSYGPLYRKEAIAVALSPVPPIAGLFPWLFGFGPVPQLNTVAIGLLPHVILDTYAFARSGMFDFYPATNRAAEQSTKETLDSPVVILEETGRIVDLNDAAAEMLNLESDAVITEPIGEILPLKIDKIRKDGPDTEQQVTLRTDGNRRVFRIQSSRLTQSDDQHVGYTLLVQDITEAVQREERLSVLNRVLRHNLRNDLSVIEGFVETAQRKSTDDDVKNLLDRSLKKTRELAETGETAREIEQLIGRSSRAEQDVSLQDLLTTLQEQFESAYPPATIESDVETVTVKTDPETLKILLSELIENAIRHGEETEPMVTVRATTDGAQTEIAVVDTGVGIPPHEIDSLEEGKESALEHGSGLGLWLAKWSAMQLGGELEFEGSSDGTTVTVTLPREHHGAGE